MKLVAYERDAQEEQAARRALDCGELVTYASTHGYAYLWLEGARYYAEVWCHQAPTRLYDSADLGKLLNALYCDWPDEGFAR